MKARVSTGVLAFSARGWTVDPYRPPPPRTAPIAGVKQALNTPPR